MLISDWSSDVCSSVLRARPCAPCWTKEADEMLRPCPRLGRGLMCDSVDAVPMRARHIDAEQFQHTGNGVIHHVVKCFGVMIKGRQGRKNNAALFGYGGHFAQARKLKGSLKHHQEHDATLVECEVGRPGMKSSETTRVGI